MIYSILCFFSIFFVLLSSFFFCFFFFFNDTATTEIYTSDTLFPYTTLFRSSAAQALSYVAIGQFVAEFHVARLLVAGEVLARVRLDLLGRQRRILLDDDQLDRLAGLLVRYADGSHLEHAGHHRDDVLDLVGVHVESRYQDHVLLAVDDVEEAFLVHLRHVAGVQPAVGVDDLCGVLGAVPVALHHLRALDAQFAHFAHREHRAVFVLDAGIGGRHWQADRAVVFGQVHRVDAGRGRGFGQAVGFDQGHAGDLLPALGHRALHRHAAAERQAQVREVDLLEAGRVEQAVEQRGGGGDCGERHIRPRSEEDTS